MRRRVKSAEAPYKHRAQVSLFSFFLLPFGDQRVGEAGGSKHSPGKKKTDTKMQLTFCSSSSFISTTSCTFWDGAVIVGFLFKTGLWEPTWHLSGSFWALYPDSACTATAPQTDSDPPCRCSPLSAAPRQTATAQQTEGLKRQKEHTEYQYFHSCPIILCILKLHI